MQVLETHRLRLQPLDRAHQALYCRIYTDPALMRHVAAPLSEEQARRSFQVACRHSASAHPAWWWVICAKASGAELGVAGLTGSEHGSVETRSVELGVMLLPEAHGRGIATETFSALLHLAFSTLNLECAHARHAPENEAMATILRKLGFRRDDRPDAALPSWHAWRLEAPVFDRCAVIDDFAKPL